MQLLLLLKTNIRIDPARRFNLVQLDLIDQFGSRGGLLGLGRIGRETADKGLQLGNLGLLLGIVG